MPTRASWHVIRRASNPDEFVALPSEDHLAGTLRRYVIYNEKTKSATFKEVNEPPFLIGRFNNIQDAIKYVMRRLG